MSWWRTITAANERVLWTTLRPAECRDRLLEKGSSGRGGYSVLSREPITKRNHFVIKADEGGFKIRDVGPQSTEPPHRASGIFVPLTHGTRVLVRLPTDRSLANLNTTIVVGMVLWAGLIWLVTLGTEHATGSAVMLAAMIAIGFNSWLLYSLLSTSARRLSSKPVDQPAIMRFLIETLEAEEESSAKPA